MLKVACMRGIHARRWSLLRRSERWWGVNLFGVGYFVEMIVVEGYRRMKNLVCSGVLYNEVTNGEK